MIAGHHDAMLSFYGTDLGLRCARKHLGWYLAEAGLDHLRDPLLTADSPAAARALILSIFGNADRRAA